MSPNLKGILLMTLAMAMLTLGDTSIKLMADRYPHSVFMMVAGIGLVVVLAVATSLAGHRILDRRALTRAPMIRNVTEVFAAMAMIYALSAVPFTILTLVMQAMPLIVTLGAVLFFRETVGPRRWAAILAGLMGVLIILRPGGQVFDPAWLFAVVAALALSARDLASRAVPGDISTLQISLWGGIGVAVVGTLMQLSSGQGIPRIPLSDIPGFLAIIGFWTGGVFAVTSAMRSGDVAVVAPFRYMRLPFGLLIGVLVFSETIDSGMILGAAVIVAAGLYIFFRERR